MDAVAPQGVQEATRREPAEDTRDNRADVEELRPPGIGRPERAGVLAQETVAGVEAGGDELIAEVEQRDQHARPQCGRGEKVAVNTVVHQFLVSGSAWRLHDLSSGSKPEYSRRVPRRGIPFRVCEGYSWFRGYHGFCAVQPRTLLILSEKYFCAGTPYSRVVASFSSSNAKAFPGEFAAVINWGDGCGTLAGTISADGSAFPHTFKSFQNIDLVTITIVDQNGRTATGIDRVVDPPAVRDVQTAALSVTTNKPFVGTLATFTDTGAFESASDFRATVTLGNRHKVTGTITGGDGQFVVSSRLPFSRSARSEKVVITVTDLLDGQSVTELRNRIAYPAPFRGQRGPALGEGLLRRPSCGPTSLAASTRDAMTSSRGTESIPFPLSSPCSVMTDSFPSAHSSFRFGSRPEPGGPGAPCPNLRPSLGYAGPICRI